MKQLLAFLLTLCVFTSFSQIDEHFSDGDFTNDPAWFGDDSLFKINSNFTLQSNSTPGTSKDICLSTFSNFIDSTQWNCLVRFNLSPSTQNLCRFYLVSDVQNLKGNVNGYFVQFGGVTGNTDSITLYKQKGNTFKRIIGGRPATVSKSNNYVRIKVLRDASGNWQLFSDTLGGNFFTIEGTGFDNEFNASTYCGFFVRFTSTNATNFYFDDIYAGPIIIDVTPPKIDSVFVLDETTLRIKFSEDLDISVALDSTKYSVDNGTGNAASIQFETGSYSSVIITFQKKFLSQINYQLTVTGVSDLNHNTLASQIIPFSFYIPKSFDIVIDEILADPDPPVGLPDYEFIEIVNKSTHCISLKNWTIEDDVSQAKLPDLVLLPDSFLIVCGNSGQPFYSKTGRTIGLTNFPSLGNDGDILILKNEKGQVIHAVNYSADWYTDNVKKNGGWTLEMIDTKNPCAGKNNWNASKNNSGGTPGKLNSVNGFNRDVSPPNLMKAYPVDNKNIHIVFDETLDSFSVLNSNLITINGIVQSVSIKPDPYFYSSFTAHFNDSFLTKNVYRIVVKNISDCAGNVIGENDLADFGLPENFDSGEVAINELLFNPNSGGVDFVELYNRSDKVIDLQKLFIANTNSDNSVNEMYPIAPNGFVLFPKEYCAISSDSAILKTQYFSPNTKNFISCTMPSYPDNLGTALIIDAYGKRYDQFSYDDKMHFPLLANVTGVSLERIDFNRPASDRTNWTSASSSVNATPAYRNSQYAIGNANGEHFKAEPEAFSPDGDGYKDEVNFSFSFEESGFTGNLNIINSQGMIVKHLIRNETLGTSGTYSWNGFTDKNEKAPVGIYIACFDVFNLKGDVKNYRSVIVVGGKI